MAKRKNPDDRPTPAPEPEPMPNPEPIPDPVAPDPAAEAGPVPVGSDPDGRLKALELAYREAVATIARQSILLDQAAEVAELLARSRDKVRRQKERLIEARHEASAAKAALDGALEGHLDLERDLLTGQGRLPFPPPDASPGTGDAAEPTVTITGDDGRRLVGACEASALGRARSIPIASVDDATAGDESWRPTPLGTLGIDDELPQAILARLQDAGIETVGDLADFVSPSPGGRCNRLVDVDGIGQAKAEKIEAALEAYWTRWSEWQAKKAAGPEGEDPAVEPDDDPAFDPTAEYDPGADEYDDQDDEEGA